MTEPPKGFGFGVQTGLNLESTVHMSLEEKKKIFNFDSTVHVTGAARATKWKPKVW